LEEQVKQRLYLGIGHIEVVSAIEQMSFTAMSLCKLNAVERGARCHRANRE
jgi:hypothetical protein